MILKLQPLASPQLRKAARGEGKRCVRCHKADGTVCGRHYNGQRQHSLGKGRGIKCHDFAVAQLCAECDKQFQEGVMIHMNADERSEEFLYLCLLTLIEREREGVILIGRAR